ncbi:MAG: polymer-forming cytoskeletal protein [Lachnospiraceae bacterium]|jgi:cytoskeletal protein CcmA (bactofilin family)|nr:polymer-forming cytoskeletal protein [Lachnospiraceae bacterium]
MGFFTDLKEDLSQVVEDLLPDDELQDDLFDELADEEFDESFDDIEMDTEDDIDGDFTEADIKLVVSDEESLEDDSEFEYEYISTDDELQMDDDANETNTMKEGNETMNEEAIFVATTEAEMMKSDISKRASDETALITMGMNVVGDITSEGSLELEGSVVGNVNIVGKLNITGVISGDSKAAEIFADNAKITGEIRSNGSVKIGQSTVIIGNIFANSAVIAGAVKGDIDVQGPVILDTSAIVMGNIKSKSVQINNGAVIEGMCSQCYADVNPTSFFDEIKKGKK